MPPLITIFNGRERRLGFGQQATVFVQVDKRILEYLPLLKGARLAVLLAIALHTDEDGWARPSCEQLSRETGYSTDTIRSALDALCNLEIAGRRVLLRHRSGTEGNRYLVFPFPERSAHSEESP